jgi:hypothetical protein
MDVLFAIRITRSLNGRAAGGAGAWLDHPLAQSVFFKPDRSAHIG